MWFCLVYLCLLWCRECLSSSYINVHVLSSMDGGEVNITCNDDVCQPSATSSFEYDTKPNNRDGIIMSIFHEKTMKLLKSKIFPTWKLRAYAEHMAWWLERVEYGRVVVLLVRRSGFKGIEKAIPTLNRLGSSFASKLSKYSTWIWVFIKGGKTLSESAFDLLNITKFSDISVHLNYEPVDNERNLSDDRQEICDKTSGMGKICDDQSTFYNSLKQRWKNSSLPLDEGQIPIMVCAGARPQYLMETLESLYNNSDVRSNQIRIIIGPQLPSNKTDETTILLIKLLGLQYDIVYPSISMNDKSANTFFYYREVYKRAISNFNESKYVIFLDEDNQVASDWYELIKHASPILDIDDSLWCINPSRGYEEVAPSGMLLRGQTHVGWGYLLRMSDVRYAVSIWPDEIKYTNLYDVWLEVNITQARECIFPALRRIKHFGIGMNTAEWIKARFELDPPFSNGTHEPFTPISELTYGAYEKKMNKAIDKAVVINENPCSKKFKESLVNDHDYKMFFKQGDYRTEGYESLMVLGDCIRFWSGSPDGFHNIILKLPLSKGNILWIIGVPFSPYSDKYKEGDRIFDVHNSTIFGSNETLFIVSHNPTPRNFMMTNLTELLFS